ncbi:MAG: alcohol dehydrogenase [Ectothiorhodospiraceae bacterium]|nr:alcohol dehydrogenase [Ectothiorhodospiraceae bacterium]
MKAIICKAYGSPENLQFREVDTPQPKPNEVLVRVHNAAVNAGDWHIIRAEPFMVRFMAGLFKPKYPILGSAIAGTVEAAGSDVSEFKVGDKVYGDLSDAGFGAFAEYVSTPAAALAAMPESLSFAEAAALPVAATTAHMALKHEAKLQAGEHVLINGASGGVGSFSVQIAKALGAEVTAVCSSRKIEMVKALGADHVIDYTKEDFTESGQQYDVIHAANGYHPLAHYKRALTPTGRYIMTGGANKQLFEAMIRGPWLSEKNGRQLRMALNTANRDDLLLLNALADEGKLKPAIDRHFPLEETPQAIRYLEEGKAEGKVIVDIVGGA